MRCELRSVSQVESLCSFHSVEDVCQSLKMFSVRKVEPLDSVNMSIIRALTLSSCGAGTRISARLLSLYLTLDFDTHKADIGEGK